MEIDKKAQGRANRKKGQRWERAFANRLKELGHEASKPRGSGFGGTDVNLYQWLVECKHTKSGVGKTVEGWLEGHDVVAIKRSHRGDYVVVMNGILFEELMGGRHDDKDSAIVHNLLEGAGC